MDMRLIFLNWYEGFKRDVGEGEWRGLMVIPWAYGNVRSKFRVRPKQGHDSMLPRKASKLIILEPVPRTNTGGQEEYSKVSEITMVKELGKMTP